MTNEPHSLASELALIGRQARAASDALRSMTRGVKDFNIDISRPVIEIKSH